ncbi:phytanoyl-CoA dioxygenase family protein [Sphingomonas yunnanensis]|uniref:phytanoyl-CoA dioxygenase family protein n=1 Tax=Sphingomonas yunnanensis TaxID=310400 RepID=UPI001CA6DE82|nr:phytanoyl-CoA dioxygenase family protein [Sphingomonas yunnanensis]MBY9062497.1 phytanoyl-CoA dioxygenase family protein [Sphingomonas yunnanensis]
MLGTLCRSADLTLNDDGAQLFAQVLDEAACGRLEIALSALPASRPGVRIEEGRQSLSFLDRSGPIGAIAASVLGGDVRPVRAILFDKTAERNWALGWHQDRTIVVKERVNTDGYGPWTVKSGLIQVEPPFEIVERMVTLRVHLDPVDETNAPLRIVPGSHRLGRLPEAEIERVVATIGERLCLAERGDIWLYATSIIHASLAADPPRRRRVLQVDFSADAAPGPLAWRGL